MVCKTHGENCDGLCIDPNVDNGMMTKIWGPPGWLFLNCVAFGYPYTIDQQNPKHTNKKHNYATFFNNIGEVLPCKYCRDSYMEFLAEDPVENHLDSRDALCKWFYEMHNKVNVKLGVPKCNIPSFEDVKTDYERFRAKCKKTTGEERENNQAKGCVTPADGTKKRCVVKVVNCDAGDITRRDNASYNLEGETGDDFVLIRKNTINNLTLMGLIVLGILIYMVIKNKSLVSKIEF
jgi:hypothetical protein